MTITFIFNFYQCAVKNMQTGKNLRPVEIKLYWQSKYLAKTKQKLITKHTSLQQKSATKHSTTRESRNYNFFCQCLEQHIMLLF